MSIQNINSAPDYINKFIQGNLEQLNKIYDEGMEHNSCGMLGFQCSEEKNKMDVQFMNEEHILKMIQKVSWEQLKKSIPENKKLFFIMDQDKNSVFLIYI
tara:strand:+ start:830 stop:1129 length:300 start_codon:yes stop_codon:yes gene_type:complete